MTWHEETGERHRQIAIEFWRQRKNIKNPKIPEAIKELKRVRKELTGIIWKLEKVHN